MKYVAGGVVLLVAIAVGLWILSRGGDEPASVFENGVLIEIDNCDHPPQARIFRCAALFCEKALYDRKIVRANTSVLMPKHYVNFSDAPDRSVHFATWETDGRTNIAKCEMTRLNVVSIELLAEMPQ
jgi:hypothetical protein